MNVTSGISKQPQTIVPKHQLKQDNYEQSIQIQITNLQEKMNTLDKDSKMSSEQKMKEKKSIEDEIQSLNNNLRQYQIEKRQKEAAETQKIAQNNFNPEQSETSTSGLSKSETGVILSLSNVGKRLVVMDKVRTDLKGQLLTATTTEENAIIQEKLDKLEKDMGKKFNESLEIVKKHQKDEKDKNVKKESTTSEDENIKIEEGEVEEVESLDLKNDRVEVAEVQKTLVRDEAKSES